MRLGPRHKAIEEGLTDAAEARVVRAYRSGVLKKDIKAQWGISDTTLKRILDGAVFQKPGM